MWVEPDLNMPDGESTGAAVAGGQAWYQQAYGVDVRIGWNPDSFGYNWQLPQIYKKSGVDYFVTQKMTWNDTNQLPFKLFWWESPDGSKVLTYFPHDYANDNLNPVRLSADLAHGAQASPGHDGHDGPVRRGRSRRRADARDAGRGDALDAAATRLCRRWSSAPRRRTSTTIEEQDCAGLARSGTTESIAKGYHEPPAPAEGKIGIPTWKSELYFEYHRGVFTTQANHKRNMRES